MAASVSDACTGRPILCELWPGNTTDVKTLVPVVTRLPKRFTVANVCIVADPGMISRQTIGAIEAQGWFYILGTRMRTVEVRDQVVSPGDRYQLVRAKGERATDGANADTSRASFPRVSPQPSFPPGNGQTYGGIFCTLPTRRRQFLPALRKVPASLRDVPRRIHGRLCIPEKGNPPFHCPCLLLRQSCAQRSNQTQ